MRSMSHAYDALGAIAAHPRLATASRAMVNPRTLGGDGVRPRASAHAAAVNGATLRVPSVRQEEAADVQPDVQGVRVVAAEVAVRDAVRRAGDGVEEGLEPVWKSNFGRLTDATCSRSCICAIAWRFHTG